MPLEEFEFNAVADRLEGWELVEFLQIPVDQILLAAQEFDWIKEEDLSDLLEFVGIKQ